MQILQFETLSWHHVLCSAASSENRCGSEGLCKCAIYVV